MESQEDPAHALGIFNFAASYWRAAKALEATKFKATHRDAPVCFLYFHAIESFLKAYLYAQGYTLQQLRMKFGHNAVKLRDEARHHGLHFDDEDVEVLSYMGETDIVIESRYLRTGYVQRPSNDALNRTCKSLHQSVGKALRASGIPVRL